MVIQSNTKVTKMSKISGVYQIRNQVNGKRYIGSSVDIYKRWKRHVWALAKGIHDNQYLQRAYDKYGKDAFIYEVIITCDQKDTIYLEQDCLDNLDPEYNVAPVAAGGNGPHTESSKKKITKANTGRVLSEESKRKISESMKAHWRTHDHPCQGRERTAETKKKLSEISKAWWAAKKQAQSL